MKTDVVDGYQLDHGFQVLLTGYPAAKKYLDFKALELQMLGPNGGLAILIDDSNLSSQMLQEGFALIDDDSLNSAIYNNDLKQAIKNNLGIWSNKKNLIKGYKFTRKIT